ncbi:MAG: LPS export ABC transporter periplasmic protein LptC [Candidatus Saccharicenans sp.]
MPAKSSYLKWLSFLRKFTLILLVTISVLIIVSLIINFRNHAQKSPIFYQPDNQSVSLQKEFQAQEFSGEKRKTSLKAEKYFLDDNKNEHLEGQVEVVEENPESQFILQAQRAVIEAGGQRLRAEGEVKIKSAEMLIKAQSLDYELEEKIIRSDQAEIQWQELNLKAGKLTYSFPDKMAVLENGMSGQTVDSENRLDFKARAATLEKEARFLKAEDLELTTGNFLLRAGEAEIYLNQKGNNFERLYLQKEAEMRWSGSGKDRELQNINLVSKELSFLRTGLTTVIKNEKDFQISGQGDKWHLEGEGEKLSLNFADYQKADKLLAKNIRLKLKKSDGESIELFGGKFLDDMTTSLLELSSGVKGKFGKYQLEADSLVLDLKNEGLEATNAFVEFKPEFFERPPVIFQENKSILVTGLKATSRPESFEIKERVKIWQGETYLGCGQADFERKTGIVYLNDKVTGKFVLANSKDGLEDVNFSCDGAGLLSGERKLVLAGSVNLKKNELKLQADEISLTLNESASDRLSRLEASRNVRAFWKGYETRGVLAHYQPEGNILIMNGWPELVTPEGDYIEADKLTLWLSDDRILIENQNRERSLSILVRRK